MNTNSISPTTPVSNQFYPLPGRQRPSNAAGITKKADNILAGFDFADALLGADSTSSQTSSSLDVADLLDLSPAAQNFLNFFNGAANALAANNNTANNNAANNNVLPVADNGLTLTPTQQAQFTAIIATFKDAPFSVGTFNNILSDLTAAGLSVQPSPVQPSAQQPLATDQANDNTYTDLIFSEWERVSSTFNPLVVATFIENPDARRKPNE